MILIHCSYEKDACIQLINLLVHDIDTYDVPISLVLDEYDMDLALEAYDLGVKDFFLSSAADAEILMRMIWGMKRNALVQKLNIQNKLLIDLGIVDGTTGFYTQKDCKQVFANAVAQIKDDNAVFIVLSANEDNRGKISTEQLAKIIKYSVRTTDVVAHSSANSFYILLANTNLQGAMTVFERLKFKSQESIAVGLCVVGDKNFNDIEDATLKAHREAIATYKDIVVVDYTPELGDNWLEKINSTKKNFKLFKQAFNKKLEKVIAPVFFQIQRAYEEKLFNTEIEQFCNSTISMFSLRNKQHESELKITYPGFSKVNIDIIHKGFDSPENRRIALELNELEDQVLISILEKFISEFRESIGE